MSALFWQSMNGVDGKVYVPSIGAVVGTINRWHLKRPEESSPGNPGLLTLQAFFSYVNAALMNDEDIPKAVEIVLTKTKHYKVTYERMAFDGSALVLEGAKLCPPDEA
jgi:hypothetical protein